MKPYVLIQSCFWAVAPTQYFPSNEGIGLVHVRVRTLRFPAQIPGAQPLQPDQADQSPFTKIIVLKQLKLHSIEIVT